MNSTQIKWDAIYCDCDQKPAPCQCLAEHDFLLPKSGSALDLACGLGGNGLLMAAQGLTVEAWDISPIALAALGQHAARQGLPILTRQMDIDATDLAEQAFDVIVVSRFLDRTLCNAIMDALKPEGLLFYQTFTRAKLEPQGPSNPEFLLDRNELLQLFRPLSLLHYQEYCGVGELSRGNRNEACFIGQKP